MTNVLLTGAFGQIGTAILRKFIEIGFDGITIHCFDLKNTKKKARKFKRKKEITVTFGDITKPKDRYRLSELIKQSDIIVHLAFIIPPITNVPLAEQVNIEGTKYVLQAIKESGSTKRLIFPSSVANLGHTPHEDQPIPPNYPHLNPVDVYGLHKKKCVELIRESDIPCFVFRLAVSPPIESFSRNITMFDVAPDDLIEVVHEKDVATAFYNGIKLIVEFDVGVRIYNIGGGSSCQMVYLDFINDKFAKVIGLGTFKPELFTQIISTAWLDTSQSQQELQYQQHSIDDIIKDMKRNNRFLFFAIKLIKPVVRRMLLNMR